MLIDTHCHLDDAQFDGDRDAVIERAVAAGVERMVAIGTGGGPPDLEAGIRLADRYPMMWATTGVHPEHAGRCTEETLAELRRLACHPKVAAIGEIGLDYHYVPFNRAQQHWAFTKQMQIAQEFSKPVVIHTREAWEDTLTLITEHRATCAGAVVLHCFTGGVDEARRALDLGCYLSFGGVTTFPKATAVQEAARFTPADRLLVETDSPYLAPIPHRGKRNEPAFAAYTLRHVAALRAENFQALGDATTSNWLRICLPQ